MNRTNILKILFAVFCLSILSCSLIGCEETDLLDPTKSQQDNEIDIFRKFQLKNESDLDKIREYNLENYQEYNGDTNFWKDRNTETSLAESKYKGTYESSTGLASRIATNSIVEVSKADRLYEDQDQLVSWLYYDAEEDDWGDAYYYTLKDENGDTYWEYAYSIINGKKKISKNIKNGAIYSKYLMIDPDTEVPQWVQKELDENDVLIINVDKNTTDNPYIGDGTYVDLYDEIDHWDDRKEEMKTYLDEIKEGYYNDYQWTYIDIGDSSDIKHNLERRLEDNDKSSELSNTAVDSAALTMLNLIDKYSVDVKSIPKVSKSYSDIINNLSLNSKDDSGTNSMNYTYEIEKGAFDPSTRQDFYSDRDYLDDVYKVSEDEYTQLRLIDNTIDELTIQNMIAWGRIGYESKYVVVRLAGVNKIVERKEAYKLIDELFDEKFRILKDSNSLSELDEATAINIIVPSYYEIKLRNYLFEKVNKFNEEYYKVRRNLYETSKNN